MLRELTNQEKSKSFAKYLSRPMTPPPGEIYNILDKGPVDNSLGLHISGRNDLLNKGYLSCERGYCLMPDGTGFIAMLTKMPGISMEMIEWWFAWHGLEDLRYAIWCTDDHLGIHVRPEDLGRRLDTSLTLRERNWNTTDVVYEDIGMGPMLLDISFMSPEDYGYDMGRFKEPNTLGAISANLSISETKTPMVTFTHIARPIKGGIELRSRFWLGWQISDKEPVIVETNIPMELVKGLAYHCPKEYANLAAILPSVYEENRNIEDRIEDFKNRAV